MKKIPVIVTAVLVLGVLLATSAFTRPLAVRNGVVSDYSAGSSITIRSGATEQTYALRGNANVLPSDFANDLGAGARVTVFGQCFAAGGSTSKASSQAPSVKADGGNNSDNDRFSAANSNYCIALAIVVREAANTNTTTSSSTGTTTGTTTPAVTATPMVTETPGTTPMVTATPTP